MTRAGPPPGVARVLARGLALLAFVLAGAGAGAGAPRAETPVPALQARVTDTTGTLSAAQRADLESALEAIERSKGSQVAILMVASTQPEPIEQYALRVAESWRLGRGKVDGRRVDDGLLIVVAKSDRRMRIEVGYGLEGAIPDAIAKRIIAERMAPRFREGDFHGGLAAAVADIGRLIAGEALPAPATSASKDDGGWLSTLLFFAFLGFIASAIFGRVLGAALSGGGGALALAQAGASLTTAAAAGLGLFFFVLLLGAFRGGLGRVGRHSYRSRPPVLFPPSGGWGGGGFGGGGGGFGGGGGGFGGGGASGDW